MGYGYFLDDHLGSTRLVLAQDGTVKQTLMYQPYGSVSNVQGITTAGTDPLRQKFTTKEFDEEGDAGGASGMDLIYFGARYLDPDLGMWTSTDPKDQLWSPYGYSTNPVNTIDPDGRFFGAAMNLMSWYVTNSITNNGEMNPAKWDWNGGMVMNTILMTANVVSGIGGEISSALYKASWRGKCEDFINCINAESAITYNVEVDLDKGKFAVVNNGNPEFENMYVTSGGKRVQVPEGAFSVFSYNAGKMYYMAWDHNKQMLTGMSFPAWSGKTGGSSPLPKGFYSFSKGNVQQISFEENVLGTIGKVFKQDLGGWPGGIKSWGYKRAWLYPDLQTEINIWAANRKAFTFSIHGGRTIFASPGSGGCIDLMGNEVNYFNGVHEGWNLVISR